jgi:hypothetical protein
VYHSRLCNGSKINLFRDSSGYYLFFAREKNVIRRIVFVYKSCDIGIIKTNRYTGLFINNSCKVTGGFAGISKCVRSCFVIVWSEPLRLDISG